MLRLITAEEFRQSLSGRRAFGRPDLEEVVRRLIEEVRREGDDALLRLTERYDGVRLRPEQLAIEQDEMEEARRRVGADFLSALRAAKAN
ncbi:MAG: histidinol dehydrogenase, partial [Firmicutes bacterium]|nr:histidinol dehydrogenase [Bacillota bacterium]